MGILKWLVAMIFLPLIASDHFRNGGCYKSALLQVHFKPQYSSHEVSCSIIDTCILKCKSHNYFYAAYREVQARAQIFPLPKYSCYCAAKNAPISNSSKLDGYCVSCSSNSPYTFGTNSALAVYRTDFVNSKKNDSKVNVVVDKGHPMGVYPAIFFGMFAVPICLIFTSMKLRSIYRSRVRIDKPPSYNEALRCPVPSVSEGTSSLTLVSSISLDIPDIPPPTFEEAMAMPSRTNSTVENAPSRENRDENASLEAVNGNQGQNQPSIDGAEDENDDVFRADST